MTTLTRAPITPRLVKRKYSNGRVLLRVVCKNGYKKIGICAKKKENFNQLKMYFFFKIKSIFREP